MTLERRYLIPQVNAQLVVRLVQDAKACAEISLRIRARGHIAPVLEVIDRETHRERIADGHILNRAHVDQSVVAGLKLGPGLEFLGRTIEVDIDGAAQRAAAVERALWSG